MNSQKPLNKPVEINITKEIAKQKMVEVSHPKTDDDVVCMNSYKQPPIDFKKVMADEINIGTETASRIIQIQSKAPEEMKEKLRKGEASINEVYKEI